jgi:hypothetical protein
MGPHAAPTTQRLNPEATDEANLRAFGQTPEGDAGSCGVVRRKRPRVPYGEPPRGSRYPTHAVVSVLSACQEAQVTCGVRCARLS